MGVQVDKPGRDGEAVEVEPPAAFLPVKVTDGRDRVAADPDIGQESGPAAAIYDSNVSKHQVQHGGSKPETRFRRGGEQPCRER